jgi:hypothetical protein
MSDKWDILYILSEDELLSLLFSSLLSSLQRFILLFFFPCLLLDSNSGFFVSYCMQGMVQIYPTTPFKKASSTRVTLEQLNWQQAI